MAEREGNLRSQRRASFDSMERVSASVCEHIDARFPAAALCLALTRKQLELELVIRCVWRELENDPVDPLLGDFSAAASILFVLGLVADAADAADLGADGRRRCVRHRPGRYRCCSERQRRRSAVQCFNATREASGRRSGNRARSADGAAMKWR